MLQIIPSTEVAEYGCRAKPVIQVTHQLQTSQLEDLLRIAVQTLGKEEVRAIVGDGDPKGIYGYRVFVEGGSCPTYTHPQYESAIHEAKRLAQKTGKPAQVVKVLAEARVQERPVTVDVKEYR